MPSAADSAAWAAHVPGGASVDLADLLADASLPGRIVRRWRERPLWPQLQDIDGRWIGSDELEERTRLGAGGLAGAGLEPGDRLVLSAATSAEFVVAYLSALRAGIVVVPINTAYTQTEVQRIVRDARPAAAAVQDDERAGWVREASATPIEVFGLDLDTGAGGGAAEIDRAAGDDPALLVYTSGTTGQPKGAQLTHGNLLASATAVEIAWRWETADRLLLALPLFHVHGLGVGINGSMCAGGSIALRPRFDAQDVADQCAKSGVSLFFGVPTMYQRLVTSGHAAALKPLRLLVSGSAPLPAELAHEVAGQTGQMPLERYGMTETIMLTSNPYDGPRKPGTVGFPLPGSRSDWPALPATSRFAARTSSPATSIARTQTPRRSPTTAGFAPATSAHLTTTATCGWRAGARS